MAELVLATDARGGYSDGDIMHANNDVSMLWRHTQIITDHRKEAGGFYKTIGNMAYERFEAVSKWKFERISGSEIRRTLLADMSNEVLSNTPNGNGHAIDVPQYMARRETAGKRAMFGAASIAVWFEGHREITLAMLSILWTDTITPETGLLEADHKQLSYSHHFLKRHLVISVNDFDNARREVLESPDLDITDPDNPILIAKRKHKILWRFLSGLSAGDITDIEDRTIKVDPQRGKLDDDSLIAILKIS